MGGVFQLAHALTVWPTRDLGLLWRILAADGHRPGIGRAFGLGNEALTIHPDHFARVTPVSQRGEPGVLQVKVSGKGQAQVQRRISSVLQSQCRKERGAVLDDEIAAGGDQRVLTVVEPHVGEGLREAVGVEQWPALPVHFDRKDVAIQRLHRLCPHAAQLATQRIIRARFAEGRQVIGVGTGPKVAVNVADDVELPASGDEGRVG